MEQLFWKIKSFHQLNISELYGILRLRQEVFAVEQNCVYLDVDGKDQFCDHLFGVDDAGRVIACCRIVQPGTSYPEVSIGRVATHPEHRGAGYGKQVMDKAISFIEDRYGKVPVRIEAQYYLEKFYIDYGFEAVGDVYLLDGIEHREMVRNAVHAKARV
ncbi:MAG TPA: GNAT family N-acetyltransferase [Chitinophagales bacterium]|nr:GNAT family N-acetyltransferase [Chitinophagales bacterium]HMU68852.1 GNAT family N-acetyltransferase [Chitinophagales bacterium]HMZ89934.1 GNAT family N-acetyltransferase [Chitinophagales bacterium]HNA58268.1 GNAT family N-acetyltransferase [Chitinophagales bacterium]HNE45472.1 GNAT family N-acetyltransferase [Chitinophagales bacterium]